MTPPPRGRTAGDAAADGSGKITREVVLAAAAGDHRYRRADALSMRRLARALDRDPMILYRHAPNKAALLDGVAETVLAQLTVDPADPDWAAQAARAVLGKGGSYWKGAEQVMSVDQGPGVRVLEDPLTNKGTAFSEEERSELGLRGLLPAVVETLEQQVRRRYQAYQEQPTDVARHINLRALQDTNEMLFYRLVSDHIEEMLPILYTPTVGLACQRFSEIYRRPRGLFIAYPDRDRIGEILRNRPRREVDVIVVTDGQRILGLGDQGIGGMGIPIGKLSLYAALGGIDPARTLPVLLDVGTDNAELLDDPMYLGWRHRRIGGADYDDFVDRFVQAVRAELPDVLLQWEDFATPHALPILERYRDQLLTFNDDIQGTAAVVLAALSAGAAATGSRLRDQTVVMLGAGSAGIGVCEQVVRSMVADGLSEQDARARIFLVDINGLLTTDRPDLDPAQRRLAQPPAAVPEQGTWPASRPHRRDRRCAPHRTHRPVDRRPAPSPKRSSAASPRT